MRSRLTCCVVFCCIAILSVQALAAEPDIIDAEPGGLVATQPPPMIDTGLAETGDPYPTHSEDRTGWLMGKIEPAVEDALSSQATVDVIVYLRAPTNQPVGIPTPTEVKAHYRGSIHALSEQIAEILSHARPDFPLTEDMEQYWVYGGPPLTDDQQTELNDLRRQLDATLDAMRHDVGTVAAQRADIMLNDIREVITDAGGTVNAEVALTLAVGATVPGYLVTELAELADVASIMLDRPQEFELDVSATTIGIESWWNAGFDGGIWDGGVVDSGVQEDHPAFASVAFQTNSGTHADSDGHGTHVAGIMASAGSAGYTAYEGIARGLETMYWAHSGNQATTMSQMEYIASSLAGGPEVVNHSLGYGTANSSDYNANDTFYDAYIQNYDILVSKSAGNGSWGSTTPTITHPAPAFNLLAVANMNDQGTTSRADDVRSGSSSTGPTVNGRRKPDITAPGSSIFSTNAFWSGSGTGTNTGCRDSSNHYDFVNCSGTSMAAPHVAGMIVVMEDGANNNPISQKAVLLNTADAWDSNDTSTTSDDGPVTGSHWDKSYGWGYLDATEAEFNRTDYFVTSLVPNNDTNVQDDYKLYVGQMFAGEKATMVWEKRGVYVAGGPASTTYSLSDLNLRLYNETTGAVVDSDLDGDDNVHQVAADSSITAVIKPYAWSSSFSGAASESIALATEENFSLVDFPTTFQGIVSRPSTVQPNEEFTYEGWIRNDSDLASHSNEVEILPPTGWTLVSGSATQNIGSIAGGSTQAAVHGVWTLQAQATPELDVAVPFRHTHDSYLEDYGPFQWNTTIDVVQDVTPPTPNPMTFAVNPHPDSPTQISMTATTASDAHGPIEYYFEFIGSTTGGLGGSDSGWTTSTTYSDSGLSVNHNFCYQVKARDTPTTAPNETAYSGTSCIGSLANPPAAGSVTPIGEGTLRVTWGKNGNSTYTDYFVENMTNGRTSGWLNDVDTWDDTDLGCGGPFEYRVKARNGNFVETAWTSLGSNTPNLTGLIFCDGFESGNVNSWANSAP